MYKVMYKKYICALFLKTALCTQEIENVCSWTYLLKDNQEIIKYVKYIHRWFAKTWIFTKTKYGGNRNKLTSFEIPLSPV